MSCVDTKNNINCKFILLPTKYLVKLVFTSTLGFILELSLLLIDLINFYF